MSEFRIICTYSKGSFNIALPPTNPSTMMLTVSPQKISQKRGASGEIPEPKRVKYSAVVSSSDESDSDSEDEWENVVGDEAVEKTFDAATWSKCILDTEKRREFDETLKLVHFADAGGCPAVFRDEAHGGNLKTVVIPHVPADAVLLTLVLHNASMPRLVPMPVLPRKKNALKQQHLTLESSMPAIGVSHLWCKPGNIVAFKTREARRGFVLGGDYGNISEGGEALFKFVATPFVGNVPLTSITSPSFMVRSKRPQVPTGVKRGQNKRLAQLQTDLVAARKQLAHLKEENTRLRLEESQWDSKMGNIDMRLIPNGPLRLVLSHCIRQKSAGTNRARI